MAVHQSSSLVIDFHHPLYLHPYDTPSTLRVSHQLLGFENYNIWTRSMEIALLAKNKVDQWKLLFLPKTNLDLLMVLVHKLIFQLIFILNGTIAMLLSSIGSSTPFAKNFQLVLFLLRVPVLFGRIFKNNTAKLMGPEFIISITLFLLTLKDLCNGRMLRIGKNMLVVLLSPTSALF
ncbi:uncharacterized protein [Gossypium hirsutum]|uniref:Uncharacterized protein isoform X2 n=1 Tax=Gossypium hirsutum TaxID=3635 RepID=A0ABM3BII3_GOSHI|nr:uncharacterized protein LOC121227957 isoform X2 [Gossypium hirsutum]